MKSTIPNPAVTKVYYVRYADDWLIGVYGSAKYTIELKNSLSKWLAENLKLELSQEKTFLTKAATSYAKFLGVYISRLSSSKNQMKNYRSKFNHFVRISSTATILTAPIKELIMKFIAKDLAEYKNNSKNMKILVGKPINKWQNLPLIDILFRYKTIWNGIINYYSFVDNKSRLRTIHWILLSSMAKLLAMKLKLKSMRKVFKKFGKDLLILHPINKKPFDFQCPNLAKTPKKFNLSSNIGPLEPLNITEWSLRTINSLQAVCASCGSSDRINMHHVRHIKSINLKLNSFDRQLAAVNRKQVPLCHSCHSKVHAGKYDGLSLKYLSTIKKGSQE